MVHGDERGLVLPPKVASVQVVIVPVAMHKEKVLDTAAKVAGELKKAGIRVELDDRDGQSPGYKFNEWELKGVPIRLEIGPKDVAQNQAVLVRRDNFTKTAVSLENIGQSISSELISIQKDLYEKALKIREEHTFNASDINEFKEALDNGKGFVKAAWCGGRECEDKVKEETGASARCISFNDEVTDESCFLCEHKAKHIVYFARAY